MAEEQSLGSFLVLLVCTGNTCRSPMAEGLLKKLLAEKQGAPSTISVTSAGTMGLVGMSATDPAIEISANYGVDIREHRSRAASPELLDRADLVLALAADHYEYCRGMGVPAERLYMLRAFPKHPESLSQFQIPDPIGGGVGQYQRTFFLIEEALRRSLPDIVQRAIGTPDDTEASGD